MIRTLWMLATVLALLALAGRVAAQEREHDALLPPEDEAVFWVEGRVELPPGTPDDERVEIASRGHRFRAKDFHRVVPDEAGRFRIAFPPHSWTGKLILTGRYLVLLEVKLDIRDPPPEVVLRPELPARLLGRLVLEDSAAEYERELVGRGVTLGGHFYEDGRYRGRYLTLHTSLDADLGFRFRDLPPGLRYRVQIDTRPLLAVEADDIELASGESRVLELPVRTGARILGRVVDEAGNGLEGFEFDESLQTSTRTCTHYAREDVGSDGAFTLTSIPDGVLKLHVTKDGYLPACWTSPRLTDGDSVAGVELVLRRGATVEGVLVWPDGTPAAGCRVELSRRDEADLRSIECAPWPDSEHVTDETGTFRGEGLWPGTYGVLARGDGDSDRSSWFARVDELQPDGEPIRLVLQPDLGFAGSVVDDRGSPVADFVARAVPIEDGYWFGNWRKAVEGSFDDDAGSFRLGGLHAGRWRLVLDAEGYAPAGLHELWLPEDGSLGPIRMPRTASVYGVVVDPEGNPAAGATLRARSTHDIAASRPDRERPTAESDAEGRFELKGVSPGTLWLRAEADGWVGSGELRLALSPAQRMEGVELVLRIGGRVAVTVLDAGGAPVADQEVLVSGRRRWIPPEGSTDASGRVELGPLPAGEHRCWARLDPRDLSIEAPRTRHEEMSAAQLQPQARFTVREGELTEVVLAPRTDTPHLVYGWLAASAAPVVGARIWMGPPGEFGGSVALTDDEGTFELAAQAPGPVTVYVSGEGFAGRTFWRELTPSESQRLDLDLGSAVLRGRVVDAEGRALEEMRVHAEPLRCLGMSGPWEGNSTFTGSDGRFDLGVFPAEPCRLVVADPRFRSSYLTTPLARYGTRLVDGVTPVEGDSHEEFVIALDRAGRLEGYLVDEAGDPVPHAELAVRDEAGRLIIGTNLASDTSGRFLVGGISPGPVHVTCRTDAGAGTSDDLVEVRAGETASTRLVVRPGTVLRVDLGNAEAERGWPRVSVTDERGNEFAAISFATHLEAPRIDSSLPGTTLGPLAPGRYRIRAARHDGREVSRELVLEGRPSEVAVLRFPGD